MWEAIIVTENNYSAPYHVAQEAIILAQRLINVFFFLHVCIYLPLLPSIYCMNV